MSREDKLEAEKNGDPRYVMAKYLFKLSPEITWKEKHVPLNLEF